MATKAKKVAVSPARKKSAVKSAKSSLLEEQIASRLSVGVRELRQDASKVLTLVKNGESVIVTEWGKPIAEIRPIKVTSIQDLIDAGVITPAKDKYDPEVWKPLPNPKGLSLLNALLKEREEARY